jgi:hypothetical protein
MNPLLSDAWASDRRAQLHREADDWRRTHPDRRHHGRPVARAAPRLVAALRRALRTVPSTRGVGAAPVTGPGATAVFPTHREEVSHAGRALPRP